jgi:hypothetical protein
MSDYDLLNPMQKVVLWFMNHTTEPIGWKIYNFCNGFVYFRRAFLTWGDIMTTEYEISSKKTFGLSWFDVFYGELDRRNV